MSEEERMIEGLRNDAMIQNEGNHPKGPSKETIIA